MRGGGEFGHFYGTVDCTECNDQVTGLITVSGRTFYDFGINIYINLFVFRVRAACVFLITLTASHLMLSSYKWRNILFNKNIMRMQTKHRKK